MSRSESVLMVRFRNGVLLEAEKRNMSLWTMIKHYDLPLALQSVFKGKNCLTPTMEETAQKLGVDIYDLLGVCPRKQKTASPPKRKGRHNRVQRDNIAA